MKDSPQSLIGKPHVRVDGLAKVTGQARYASDEPVADAAFAYLVTSSISKGRVRGIKLDAAHAVPGVLDILTHENVGREVEPPPGPDDGPTTTFMETDKVWHDGQVVGIVVAETYEAAREAANKIVVDYAAEPPSATFDSPGAQAEVRIPDEMQKDPQVGDAPAAFAAAPVRIDARYATPIQHHNPIELFTTTWRWCT